MSEIARLQINAGALGVFVSEAHERRTGVDHDVERAAVDFDLCFKVSRWAGAQFNFGAVVRSRRVSVIIDVCGLAFCEPASCLRRDLGHKAVQLCAVLQTVGGSCRHSAEYK